MRNRNLALVLPLCAVVLGALCSQANAVRSTTTRAASAGCTLPLTRDPYDGYHVGVPAGWGLYHVEGRLVVTPSATAPEQSIVIPALLTSGLTPSRFFSASMEQLDKSIASAGNAMSYHVTSNAGGLVQASLSGRAGTVALSGHASVLLLPDQTAHGSQLVVLSAYWAPPPRLAADGAKLAAVALCYGPEPAPLFRVFSDQAFTYAIPPNFRVTSEGQDDLTIAQGSNAWASFLLTLLPPTDGVNSVQTLQHYIFQQEKLTITHMLGSAVSPTQSASGATNQLEDIEFTGTLDGTIPVHGLASVYASVGVDVAGTIRLALTRTSYWNSTQGAVVRIAGGIQHSFTQDLQQWERLSQQAQQFGQQVSGFDQALNGEDLVQNTATGETFEAPYSSYQKSGPDGPGYYTGSVGDLQKLQIVTSS
jgi:hypothetical protein